MNLLNKTVVVTGGTSGIGLALVRQLCLDNQVIVISRCGRLPGDLVNGARPVHLYHADLAIKADIEAVVDKIQKTHPVIDLLVNNAAIQCTPEFLSDHFNFDAIQTEINVNFTSICHLTYLFMPGLLAAEAGVILNMNSGLAIAPKRGSAIYCATKSALDSLSKSLSYQLDHTSVRVQQVFLPLVETPMTDGRGSGKLKANAVAERIINGIRRRKRNHDVGKVRLLRLINRVAPPLAQRIMRAG